MKRKIKINTLLLLGTTFIAIILVIQLMILRVRKTAAAVHTSPVPGVQTETVLPSSELSIDFGDGTVIRDTANAKTALEALTVVSARKNLPIQTKSYSIGTLVEKIGSVSNSSSHYWIYEVNGQGGTVAADRYELRSGDQVRWYYTGN
jgi:hypothetical protein